MSVIQLVAYKNEAGQWLQIFERNTHTGLHQTISFVGNINEATVFRGYIPHRTKEKIQTELFQVNVSQKVIVTEIDSQTDIAIVAAPVNLKSSVPVSYWDNYSEKQPLDHQFQIDVDDQRASNGQMFIDIGSKEGNLDNLLYLSIEINRLHTKTGTPVSPDMPCVHMHFDGENLAGSFFKVADKIIFRPENGTTITSIQLSNGESAYEINTSAR